MSETRLVLLAHGSRDPRWRRPFEALCSDLRKNPAGAGVRLAYMEFAEPTLADVAREEFRSGIRRLRVLPLFFAGGAHVARDIPAQVEEARSGNPGLRIELLSPVGEHPEMRALLMRLAQEAAMEQ